MTPQSFLRWAGGSVEFDALIAETPAYEADVPTAPTEEGYVASDCTAKPMMLKLEVAMTDSSLYRDAQQGRVADAREKLLALQRQGTRVTAGTDLTSYENLVLQSVGWARAGMADSVVFALTLREVQVAQTRTVAGVAPRKKPQRTPEADEKHHHAEATKPKDSLLLTLGDGKLGSALSSVGLTP